jgi:hypothetical protein
MTDLDLVLRMSPGEIVYCGSRSATLLTDARR